MGEVGKKRGERERRRGLNDHAYVTCCSKIRDDITSEEEEMGDPFAILWKYEVTSGAFPRWAKLVRCPLIVWIQVLHL